VCVLFPCTYNRQGPLDEFWLQVDEDDAAAQWAQWVTKWYIKTVPYYLIILLRNLPALIKMYDFKEIKNKINGLK